MVQYAEIKEKSDIQKHPVPPESDGLFAQRKQQDDSASLQRIPVHYNTGKPAQLQSLAIESALEGMQKEELLFTLKERVTRLADGLLAQINQTTADCPYINKWFGYYSEKSKEHIENAIMRFAPQTASAKSMDEYVAIVLDRVSAGLKKHISTGTIEDVPEEIIDKPHKPEDFQHIAKNMHPVVQMSALNPINWVRGREEEELSETEKDGLSETVEELTEKKSLSEKTEQVAEQSGEKGKKTQPEKTDSVPSEKVTPPKSVEELKKDISPLLMKKIPYDGNCLYNAVRRAIEHEDDLRAVATQWLLMNPRVIADLIRFNEYEDTLIGRLQAYQRILDVVITPGQWAGGEGDLSPHILARALGRRIRIIIPGATAAGDVVHAEVGTEGDVVVIYYNGLNHYSDRREEIRTARKKEAPVLEKTPSKPSKTSISTNLYNRFCMCMELLKKRTNKISDDEIETETDETKLFRMGRMIEAEAFKNIENVNKFVEMAERLLCAELAKIKKKPTKTKEQQPPEKEAEEEKPPREYIKVYKGGKVRTYGIKGQKGDFIGDPSAVHIHLVGGNDHLKLSGKGDRYDINARTEEGRRKRLLEALEALLRVNKETPGYDDCLRWLCQQLDLDHTQF